MKASAYQVQNDTFKKDVIDTVKKDLFTVPDTVQYLHSKPASLVPPAVLVAYGVASFYAHPLRHFDRYIYTSTQNRTFVTKTNVENYIQYAPVVLTYGLNLVGVHGKNTFVDRTLTLALAGGMLELTTFTIKHATHRLRPNGADRYSFPSGHTSNAFLEAEFMSQELSGNSVFYGIAGYAFATATGTFRIYHHDHWFSDVVAGAGFGILATKGAYLLYPYIRNSLFKGKKAEDHNSDVPKELKKQSNRSALLLPTYQQGTFGLQFSTEL